eukprot:NODE_7131_length_463_cov_78.797619_g6965_i0.p2 GENE.NODE_7131_length_463_cov_78.797619_g6965_i0~~NODE_7131_length_463_cov_78.797619_g6965_i0.p2  ORF type:complete len:117 (-),score=6.07 NODE_7131_length_463_cov_78.797619_g6965_i0:58-408(-)
MLLSRQHTQGFSSAPPVQAAHLAPQNLTPYLNQVYAPLPFTQLLQPPPLVEPAMLESMSILHPPSLSYSPPLPPHYMAPGSEAWIRRVIPVSALPATAKALPIRPRHFNRPPAGYE